MLRMLLGQPLPQSSDKFLELVRIYFPNLLDMKSLAASCRMMRPSLLDMCDVLEIVRCAPGGSGCLSAALLDVVCHFGSVAFPP